MRDDGNAPVYPVGTVSRLTGLSPRQIRYYDKVGLVVPQRSEGGHRLYSREQMEELTLIAQLREKDYSLPEVRKELQKRREQGGVTRQARRFSETDASFRFDSISEPSSIFGVMRCPQLLSKVRSRSPASGAREPNREE